MKRLLFILLFLSLALCSCGRITLPETQINVGIEEGFGFTVEENGISILPGEDAVFKVCTESGFSITGTDYSGDCQLSQKGHVTILTLKAVPYPTRIHLNVSSRYCTVTYKPNGGEGTEQTISYDLSVHTRPNSSIGTDIFSREGFTLIGWNTEADGSGTAIGLGSRISVPDFELVLYAQWRSWSNAADFDCVDGAITGYHGTDDPIVVPEILNGVSVTAIAAGAFLDCGAKAIIFPKSLRTVEDKAFQNCAFQDVTLFDNIVSIPDNSFVDCPNLQTLHINAIEAPFGYLKYKESCYADKVDLLINAQGQKKLVFYGGCSMWYNLNGIQVQQAIGDEIAIINMGLNGTVTSTVQLQIMTAFLEKGDTLFHTPEISSRQQLLLNTDMGDWDKKLWAGLENNYDLFALVDLREVGGVFDSLCNYLSTKNKRASYEQYFVDDQNQVYCDKWGCVPITRATTESQLADNVFLGPNYIDTEAMSRLESYYGRIQDKGVRIYLSYACVNMDEVPENQRGNVKMLDTLFHQAIEKMDGPVLISTLSDYLYHHNDFFDTNYHLRSAIAAQNTAMWLRDLEAQLEKEAAQ